VDPGGPGASAARTMVRRKRSAPEAEPEGGAEAEREEEDEQKAPEAEENAPEAGESDEAEENAPKAEEADEAEPDEEDDDDDEFDFGAVADEAVKKVAAARHRHRVKDITLDIGLNVENLYLTPRSGRTWRASAFDTTAPPGENRLDYRDYAQGAEVQAASSSSLLADAREVRGVQPRPVDDRSIRKKEAKAERESKLEKWFGLRRHKMTPELEKELRAIKLRANFDPKRFYKANDDSKLPKYFTVATEVGGGMRAAGYEDNRREVTATSGRSFLSEVLRDEKAQEWTAKKAWEVRSRDIASLNSGHGNPRKPRSGGANWKRLKRH